MLEQTFATVDVPAVIAAMGAIGTAAFGLVDGSKALWGGVSNVGFGHLGRCLNRFDKTLTYAIGPAWIDVFRAHWRNGVPKADQKAIVRSLIRLGMSEGSVEELAAVGHVEPATVRELVKRLESGSELAAKHLNALGRVDASVDALMDAAFERADQQYRNGARALAGVVAILLSLTGALFVFGDPTREEWFLAVAVGVLAVPVAPIAKDLTSALTTAARSLAAIRGGAG